MAVARRDLAAFKVPANPLLRDGYWPVRRADVLEKRCPAYHAGAVFQAEDDVCLELSDSWRRKTGRRFAQLQRLSSPERTPADGVSAEHVCSKFLSPAHSASDGRV